MRSVSVVGRHRAHHSPSAWACAVLVAAVLAIDVGCGGGKVPLPPRSPASVNDYVAVPFPPRSPQVEIVPAQPRSDAVWADGSWEWDADATDENGGRYRWQPGAWVVVPEGVSYARWIIVRRKEDGQLFFAPSSWHDDKGRTVSAPEAITRAQSGRSQIEE